MKLRMPPPLAPAPASAWAASSSAWKGEGIIGVSALLRYWGRRHRLEFGQRLDAAQPGLHGGIGVESDAALGRMGDVGIAGEVGDRRILGRQIAALGEMRLHEAQKPLGD